MAQDLQVSHMSAAKITTPCLFSISADNVAPVVTCIDDVSSTIGINLGGTVVQWVEPTATDNSGVVSLASQTRVPGSFFPVGQTSVTYRFVDGSGNSATCTFQVIVIEG